VFHALAEVYHGSKVSSVAVEVDDLQRSDELAEAYRLLNAYTKRFTPEAFGHVVSVEEQAETEINGYGVTARFDMVVDMDEQTAGKWRERGLDVYPGRYIVDHKTMDRKKANMESFFKLSPQFMAYPMIYNAVHQGEPQCLGMIANCVIRHKTFTNESFQQLLIDAPTEAQIHSLEQWITLGGQLEETNGCNLSGCINSWGRVCSHYESGRCTRS